MEQQKFGNSLKNNENSKKINITNNNYDYEEQDKVEFTPKYYRNNPLVKKGNIQKQKLYMGNREENPLKSVAQKICNIIIKGDDTKKKEKSKKF